MSVRNDTQMVRPLEGILSAAPAERDARVFDCSHQNDRCWPVAPRGRPDCRAPVGSDQRWTGHGASTMNAPQMTQTGLVVIGQPRGDANRPSHATIGEMERSCRQAEQAWPSNLRAPSLLKREILDVGAIQKIVFPALDPRADQVLGDPEVDWQDRQFPKQDLLRLP
jgi:hypothetical protein